MSDIFFDFEEMRLPDWLDKKLFVELGANYNPDPNKVKYTLNDVKYFNVKVWPAALIPSVEPLIR